VLRAKRNRSEPFENVDDAGGAFFGNAFSLNVVGRSAWSLHNIEDDGLRMPTLTALNLSPMRDLVLDWKMRLSVVHFACSHSNMSTQSNLRAWGLLHPRAAVDRTSTALHSRVPADADVGMDCIRALKFHGRAREVVRLENDFATRKGSFRARRVLLDRSDARLWRRLECFRIIRTL